MEVEINKGKILESIEFNSKIKKGSSSNKNKSKNKINKNKLSFSIN